MNNLRMSDRMIEIHVSGNRFERQITREEAWREEVAASSLPPVELHTHTHTHTLSLSLSLSLSFSLSVSLSLSLWTIS